MLRTWRTLSLSLLVAAGVPVTGCEPAPVTGLDSGGRVRTDAARVDGGATDAPAGDQASTDAQGYPDLAFSVDSATGQDGAADASGEPEGGGADLAAPDHGSVVDTSEPADASQADLATSTDALPEDRATGVDTEPGVDSATTVDGATAEDGSPSGGDAPADDASAIVDAATEPDAGASDTSAADTGDGDECPFDPDESAPGTCGCGLPDVDTDLDGALDCEETCPGDPLKQAPRTCGCGTPDTNTDGDALPDCIDGCDDDPLKTSGGLCGCGVADTDTDADGTPDCLDGCLSDPNKTSPGICDCGVPDDDSDNDGSEDCIDHCPNDPGRTVFMELYHDSDHDGYGDPTTYTELVCAVVVGLSENDLDCDDDNGSIHPGAEDLPDLPATLDRNCDGIDGDIARAYFVSTAGNDGNAGSMASPFKTVQAAVDAAAADPGRDQVYIRTGDHLGGVVLADGVSLFGGYSLDWSDRRLDPFNHFEMQHETVLRWGSPTIEVNGYTGEGYIQALTVVSSWSTSAWSNRVILAANVIGTLHVEHNRLETNSVRQGAYGVNGESGDSAYSAGNGADGTDGTDTAGGVGGARGDFACGVTLEAFGGKGGDGGFAAQDGFTGMRGGPLDRIGGSRTGGLGGRVERTTPRAPRAAAMPRMACPVRRGPTARTAWPCPSRPTRQPECSSTEAATGTPETAFRASAAGAARVQAAAGVAAAASRTGSRAVTCWRGAAVVAAAVRAAAAASRALAVAEAAPRSRS